MSLGRLFTALLIAGAAMTLTRGVGRRRDAAPSPPRTDPRHDAEPAMAKPRRSRWRSALAAARLLAMLAFVVVWVLLLRPQTLGGPAIWVLVSGASMEPHLHDGDLALTQRRATYRRGDVIAYRIPSGDVGAGTVVIHRITGGNGRTGYATRGDNRARADLWRPTDADVAGRLVATVPAVGSVLELLRTPLILAAFAGLAAFLSVPARRRTR